MVVDEELKMMARICEDGGRVLGPYLKEMAHLAHTEYFIEGQTSRDVREVLRETLFAPTVTGSPLESACRVIRRYEPQGRGYYSGVAALIGGDGQGGRTLDSAILIRTAEIEGDGRLRIGVIPTVAPYLLPQVIKTLTRHYPGLEARPREAVTQKLIEDLLEARLDMAIVALPVSEPSLEEIPLFSEEFILVRPMEDAGMPVPSADKLGEMRLLLLEEGHCFRNQALSFCSTTNAPPRVLMEGSSLSTLVQMVGAGIGVTLIPQMAVDMETRQSTVSVFRLAEPRPSRTIGIVWRKSNPLSAQFAHISEIVRDCGLQKLGLTS